MKKVLVFVILNLFFFNISFADNLKVIDGDTIILKGEKIRFSGIDAPELKQICIDKGQEIFCGVLAKKLLIEKIDNKIPTCIKDGKDFYKRILAECFIDEESLSSYLVKNGFAFAYRKYSKKFIEDEEFAKTNKLGLWSMNFQYPWDYRKEPEKIENIY